MKDILRIKVSQGGREAKEFTFESDRVFVGSSSDCDVLIEDPACAKLHAEIFREGSAWRLKDLNTQAGTFVSGQKITTKEFEKNIAFSIGRSTLSVSTGEESAGQCFLIPGEAGLPIKPFPLQNRSNVIGRAEDADFQIDEMSISRKHARIDRTGDDWCLVDLDSHNGCFVNGQRIEKTILKPGDEILLGRIPLRFEVRGGTPGAGKTVIFRGPIVAAADAGAMTQDIPKKGASPPSLPKATHDLPPPSAFRKKGNDPVVKILLLAIIGLLLVAFILFLLIQLGRKPQPAGSLQGKGPPRSEARVKVKEQAPAEVAAEVKAAFTSMVQPASGDPVSFEASGLAGEPLGVFSEVAGIVEQIGVRKGERIETGQTLVLITDPEVQRQYDALKAETNKAALEQAQEKLRQKRAGRASEQEISEAEEECQALEDDYRENLRELKDLQAALGSWVVAPVNGTLQALSVRVGQDIEAGDSLVDILPPDARSFQGSVSSSEASDMRPGDSCDIEEAGIVSSGVIRSVDEEEDGRWTVVVDSTEIPAAQGEGNAIVTWAPETSDLVLVIPEDAVFEMEGQSCVFFVDEDRAGLCEVAVGRTWGGNVEVERGLDLGDQVLVEFPQDLQVGQLIRITGEDEPEEGTADSQTETDPLSLGSGGENASGQETWRARC